MQNPHLMDRIGRTFRFLRYLGKAWIWVLFISLIISTRLPCFLSGNLVLDGDECIVGLMALHTMQGEGFPFFFYGQNYGFTLMESLLTASFYCLAGYNGISVKMAMLFLWSLGCLFMGLSFRRLYGYRACLLSSVSMILCPAWGVWAMKARGGYLSAFFLFHLAIWLIVLYLDKSHKQDSKVSNGSGAFNVIAACIGICGGLTLLSQPIWFVALLPFILAFGYREWKNGASYPVKMMICASSLVIFVVLLFSIRTRGYYYAPSIFSFRDMEHGILLLPHRMYVFFSGIYVFGESGEFSIYTTIAAWMWSTFFILLLAFGCVCFKQNKLPIAITLLSIIGVSLFSLFLSNTFGYRYLLPIPALTIAVWIILDSSPIKKWIRVVLTSFGIATLASSIPVFYELQNFTYDGKSRNGGEEKSIQEMIHFLKIHEVSHVYCMDPMFQWNIIFYSKESVLARWTETDDRYPKYIRFVDKALYSGKPVAIVGKAEQARRLYLFLPSGSLKDRLWFVNERYFVFLNANTYEIKRLGFKLE